MALQDEVPKQEEMPLRGVGGFLPYRANATLVAVAMKSPPSIEECGALRTPYLDKFLPPRTKSRGPAKDRVDLDFVYSPIVDLSIPAEGT